MNVDFINPVYKATTDVFKSFFALNIERGTLQVKDEPVFAKEANVAIKVSGDLEGFFLFSLTKDMALNIVFHMAGMRLEEINEIVVSAVGEFANMISGHVLAEFEENNYTCDITTPDVSIGSKNKKFKHIYKTKTLVIPLKTELGEFDLNVALGIARRQVAR
ncbi:MAG: chemotaxis protein CheX [bacterium]